MAYAKLQIRVNGGAPQSGGITVNLEDELQLTAESKVGWGSPPARWEVYDYPPGMGGGAFPGWTHDATADVYFWVGNGDPPLLTWPDSPTQWGKMMFRLTILDGLGEGYVDEKTAAQVLSANGLEDVAWLEKGQFSSTRQAVRGLKLALRSVENGGGGGIGTDPTANSIALSSHVAVGSGPAGAGDIRGSKVTEVRVKNDAGSADARAWSWGESAVDELIFGDASHTVHAHYHVKTGGEHRFYVNNSQTWEFSGASLTGTGNVAIQAPGGSMLLLPATDFVAEAGANCYLKSGGVVNLAAEANRNVCIGATAGSYGGGQGTLFMANRTAAPITNPSGGYLVYGEANALKGRGGSGTVATIGTAEPHCTNCGRDYAIEYRNDDADEHVAVCLFCMREALDEAGVDTSFFFIAKFQPAKARVENLAAAAERQAEIEAAEAARPRTRRERWAERRAAEVEAARAAARRRVLAQHATDLATQAAAVVGDDDEAAAFLLAESADAWAAAGGDLQADMAKGLAIAVAPPDVRAELEGS